MKNGFRPRQLYRFFFVLLLIGVFLLHSIFRRILFRAISTSKKSMLETQAKLIQSYSRRCLRLLNIDVRQHGRIDASKGLLISNHISYVDVLVISSLVPTVFVTSVETQNSGWVGTLCSWAGCLFVERRSRAQFGKELDQISEVLNFGVRVTIFPEATSSDGNQVLPFKSGLFESAIQSELPVHVLALKYSDSTIPYYGDMTLLPHLYHLCSLRKTTARAFGLGSLPTKNLNRKELAMQSYDKIQSAYVSRA